MRTLLFSLCWLASAVPPAVAQAPAMPNTQEIEQRMRPQDLRMPGADELRRAAPSMPNVDALPDVPAAPAPDLAELASRYERLGVGSAATPAGGERAVSGLLVFVSLGMPSASLEMLVDDAERSGALLVLRGVKDGSLKTTKAMIQQLIGKRRVAWQIDPTLYRALRIEAVPTYVLVDPNQPIQRCQSGDVEQGAQCGQPPHSRVAGDVTLRRALLAMAQADAAAAVAAAPYLRRLEGGMP
ncbi:type-F conjugative transfer system pilin assembly protein TrbC [Ideonella sp. YS5]|uniref:type-F conjugative transfer system pilin assembly protein TrbC n=1 Tax=Ideonella sp. YS5 TaxID=3453714 RepID=UPI003EEFF069